jgi:hypothetical protein
MPTVQFSLAMAKRRLARAHAAALESDPSLRVTYDRWRADMLAAAKGAPKDAQAAMHWKLAIVLEVLAERQRWPGTIAGLVKRPAKPSL